MEFKESLFVIGGIVGAITAIVTPIAVFFKAKGMDEAQQKANDVEFKRHDDSIKLLFARIDDLKKADADHEKEDWKMRSELELKIAVLHGSVSKLDAKLDSIEKKIDTLIEDWKNKRGA